jgi:predicted transcriptional regulator
MLTNLKKEIDLLRRHEKILQLVLENEPVGIIKLAELSGMPQHKVRYSLRILEQKRIIRPSPRGAMTTQKAKTYLKTYPKEIEALSEELLASPLISR